MDRAKKVGREGGRACLAYQEIDRVFLVSDFNGTETVFQTTLKSEASTSRATVVALKDEDP